MSDESAGEGGLKAPLRHPIAWRDESYYSLDAIEAEMERVFDICHGCRRCFNLCDSFPILFDLVDGSPTEEVDGVAKADFAKVADACTLCDMCFMTKCPYVPPHPFDVDFPHLILRHRAAKRRAGERDFVRDQLGETDRNGKLAAPLAPVANWASDTKNRPVRKTMEALTGIDADAPLPRYHAKTAERLLAEPPAANPKGPAFGKRKALIYATCFADYNEPETAVATAKSLARLGVAVRLDYPGCCGMPKLESGDLAAVAKSAETVAAHFAPLIAGGHDVVALTASCALMLKFEWPLILPDNEDVARLAAATRDVGEYVVEVVRAHGEPEGLKAVPGGVTLHHACHARAQAMGIKSAEMLRLIPDTKVDVVERCSGHGGTFGVMKATRPHALRVGRPTSRLVAQKENAALCSDCPLACRHLGAMVDAEPGGGAPLRQSHPIEIFARALGVV
jgi:glycerol-3-phosphate dehydrogenase subunit C